MDITGLPSDIVRYQLYPLLDPASKVSLWLSQSAFRIGEPPPKLGPKDYCHGSLELFREFSRGNRREEIVAAASHGNLKVLQYILEGTTPVYGLDSLCASAASAGSIPCLEYLISKGYSLTVASCYEAARNGHLECLKWLRANGCPWNGYIINGVAQVGHAEVLQYCLEGGFYVQVEALTNAAENGHLKCLKILWRTNPNLFSCPSVSGAAASHGHIRILEFLQRKGRLVYNYGPAITGQQIEVMKWLHHLGHPLTHRDYRTGVETGNLEIMRLLDEWRCPRDVVAFRIGVVTGDLALVKYLRETGCPVEWNEVPIEAARHQDSSLLKYLHQSGLSLPEEIVHEACGSFACLSYLCRLGYRLTTDDGVKIVESGDLRSLRLYWQYGSEYISEFAMAAVRNDDLKMLKLLLAEGCPYSVVLYDEAIIHRANSCREYLRTLFTTKEIPARHHSL